MKITLSTIVDGQRIERTFEETDAEGVLRFRHDVYPVRFFAAEFDGKFAVIEFSELSTQ